MSTRWYPIYQRGNPQLRVFLPNFWMKLVKPMSKQPPNIVMFHCSMEMTKIDVENYLKKIYDVNPVLVRIRIHMGEIKRQPTFKYVIKEDDFKVAYAVLPKDQSFIFPDITGNKDEKEKEEKQDKELMEEMKKDYKVWLSDKKKPGVPGWFSI